MSSEQQEKPKSETQLYVSNLPFSLDDEGLAELFGDFRVKNAYVARRRNGRSKGFGFVDLEDNTEQQRAFEALDGQEFGGRPLAVSVALVDERRDASGQLLDEFKPAPRPARKPRSDAGGNAGRAPRIESETIVYVSNLPFEYEESDLEELFAEHKPKSVRVARRRNNRSKGYGFVEFEDSASQQAALALNGHVLQHGDGEERIIQVVVSLVPDPTQAPASNNDAPARNPEDDEPSEIALYVSNLPFELTDEALGELFTAQGFVVTSARVARRRAGKRSKGFGFIVFADNDNQTRALAAAEGMQSEDRDLIVKIARKGSEKAPEPRARKPRANNAPKKERRPQPEKIPSETMVFVSNLSFDTTDEGLKGVFSDLNVTEGYVATRRNGRSKGFGFITFGSNADQQAALLKTGTELDTREINVAVAYDLPADDQAEETN